MIQSYFYLTMMMYDLINIHESSVYKFHSHSKLRNLYFLLNPKLRIYKHKKCLTEQYKNHR